MKKLVTIVISVILALSIAFSFNITVFASNSKLKFVLISDMHYSIPEMQNYKEETNVYPNSIKYLKYALESDAVKNSDLIASSGDITNGYNSKIKPDYNATKYEFENFYKTIKQYYPNKMFISAAGNHDFYNEEPASSCLFIKYQKTYFPNLNKTYYSYEQNGYKFVVIGAETGDGKKYNSRCNIYISKAQMEWFENELKSASESKMPVFVLAHNPIMGISYFDDITHSIGDQSDQVRDIMRKYSSEQAPIIYCFGHYHHNFSNGRIAQITTDNNGSLYYVDVPSLGQNGLGYEITVSENEIIINGYDFINNKVTGSSKSIPIKSDSSIINWFVTAWKWIVKYLLFGWLIDIIK